jgi:hypothetical protein
MNKATFGLDAFQHMHHVVLHGDGQVVLEFPTHIVDAFRLNPPSTRLDTMIYPDQTFIPLPPANVYTFDNVYLPDMQSRFFIHYPCMQI